MRAIRKPDAKYLLFLFPPAVSLLNGHAQLRCEGLPGPPESMGGIFGLVMHHDITAVHSLSLTGQVLCCAMQACTAHTTSCRLQPGPSTTALVFTTPGGASCMPCTTPPAGSHHISAGWRVWHAHVSVARLTWPQLQRAFEVCPNLASC
jgi:hypothetical protein